MRRELNLIEGNSRGSDKSQLETHTEAYSRRPGRLGPRVAQALGDMLLRYWVRNVLPEGAVRAFVARFLVVHMLARSTKNPSQESSR